MATTTARLGLRKPDPDPVTGDFINPALDLNDNFDKVDAASGAIACTSGTRPGSPYNGQMARETDTGRLIIWNGSSWMYVFMDGIAYPNTSKLAIGADLGNPGVSLQVASSGTDALRANVSGDGSNYRIILDDTSTGGRLQLGSGGAAADVNLYRAGTDHLKTDDWLTHKRRFFHVRRTATQSITNGTGTPVSWTSEISDVDNMIVVTVDNFTIPTGLDGVWHFDAFVRWVAGNTGTRIIWFEINGTANVENRINANSVGGQPTSQVLSMTRRMVAADVVKLIVFHTQGVALNVDAGSDQQNPQFAGYYLGT